MNQRTGRCVPWDVARAGPGPGADADDRGKGRRDWRRAIRIAAWCAGALVVAIGLLVVRERARRAVLGARMAARCRRPDPEAARRTLFVSIVARGDAHERDAALLVGALFERARHPTRVHVGLCRVAPDAPRPRRGPNADPFMWTYRAAYAHHGRRFEADNIRILDEEAGAARGPSNALFMAHRHLYRGQRYYAVVHVGCRPCRSWDTMALSDLDRAVRASGHARVFITMPMASRAGDEDDGDADGDDGSDGGGGDDDESGDDASRVSASGTRRRARPPNFAAFETWSARGMPVLRVRRFRHASVRPFGTPFWHSAFALCDARALEGASPWDPWMEHLPMARAVDWCTSVRLWTRGWDFYTPTRAVVVRATDRDEQDRDGNDDSDYDDDDGDDTNDTWSTESFDTALSDVRHERNAAYARAWTLLGMAPDSGIDLAEYGLGSARDAATYARLSGVDWMSRCALAHAFVGMWPAGDRAVPFDDEEVIAKYGSWSRFLAETDYRPDAVVRW